MGRYLDAIEVEERALEIAQEYQPHKITLLKLALIVEDEEI